MEKQDLTRSDHIEICATPSSYHTSHSNRNMKRTRG